MSLKERTILISESFNNINEHEVKFRFQIRKNGHPDNIEKDLFEAIKKMNKAKVINIDELYLMFKREFGLGIDDTILFTNQIISKIKEE